MMQLQAITEIEAHTILARELTGSEACDQFAEDCALISVIACSCIMRSTALQDSPIRRVRY